MTLPAAPPITLAQVRVEFGAPVGTPLHAFNRGGAWVPNTPGNSGVPTAAPIRLAQLCGASAYTPMVISGPNPRTWFGEPAKPPVKFYASSAQSVAGGNTGKTYSWTKISGENLINCSAPTTLAGSFWASGGYDDGTGSPETIDTSAVWRLSVNDGVATVTRDVTFHFVSSPP